MMGAGSYQLYAQILGDFWQLKNRCFYFYVFYGLIERRVPCARRVLLLLFLFVLFIVFDGSGDRAAFAGAGGRSRGA